METLAVIIPAAGSGSRLQADIPKPFIEIAGASIIEHTIQKFLGVKGISHIVISTSAKYLDRAIKILDQTVPQNIKSEVVQGGKERQDSIYNALQMIDSSDLVAVHDAVRPFITTNQIQQCCTIAAQDGGAIIAVPAKDTIKQVNHSHSILGTPDRSHLWQAQTPQIFKREIIKKAYHQAITDNFKGTDDASLAERIGATVKVVEGSRENFKITYPLDLQVANILLTQ